MNKIKLNTIGADAEVFLRDKETLEIVSAEGFIKGTKYKPYVFDKKERWFTTSLDNVLAEVTIPPADTADKFSDALLKAIDYVRKVIPQNLEPIAIPSANLADKYLMTENAMLFGCEPDFNAYSKSINEKPWCDDYSMRSGGSHVHLGFNDIEVPFNDNELFNYDASIDTQRCNIVKALDLFISIPLVLMEPDSKRKELYGKAGAFRPKSYGIEYRTPSNYYLNSKELMNWVYNSSVEAVNFLNTTGKISQKLAKVIKNTINNNDKEMATALINDFKLAVV